jgi:hypothetical protein
MKKNLHSVKAILVLSFLLAGLLLGSVLDNKHDFTVSARQKLLTFASYIELTYDSTALNQDLAIDRAINVPLTVSYTTDVPANFGRFLPWQIRNIFLFGSMIVPKQTIHLEIINKPSWANIYLSDADVEVDIPFRDNKTNTVTSLVISPREEAPAVPQSIEIKMTCNEIGRVKSTEKTITINVDQPIRTVSPRETVRYKIDIKNNGNKKIRVTPQLVNIDEKWSPTINPPFQDIDSSSEGYFIFSVYAPYDFGWHNEIKSFQINFTVQIFPPREGSLTGGPYSIYLQANNYGFSTPGFEIITLIAALIIVGVIFTEKKRHIRQ